MKKIVMFLKSNYLYFISELFGLYFVYLICRQFDFKFFQFIIIFIIVSLISLLLTKKFKSGKNYNFSKHKLYIYISLSIITSLLFISINFDFFTKKYINNIIEISSIENKEISMDVIKDLYISNDYYTKNKNYYFKSDIIENKIILKFNKIDNITLKLNNLYGNLNIKDNGNNTIIDFSDNTNMIEYNVSNNKIKDNLFFIRTILSFIFLDYIFSMLYIIFFNKKEDKGKIVIYIICLFIMSYFFNFVKINRLSPDSYVYINYNFNRLLNLKLNGSTPIYPIIISIIKACFGIYFLHFLTIFQYILWYISIIYLYKILSLLIKNDKVNTIFTLLYAISPTIVLWSNIILTESLALSGTLIFIYYIFKFIKTNKCKYGYISIIISFILTFHKPTCIIYFLLLIIFFIFKMIFDKNNIKNSFKCLRFSFIFLILIILYAILFHKSYEIYSISDAVVRQDLIVNIEQKYYKSSNDPEFIQFVDRELEEKQNTWDAMWVILGHYGNKRIKEITNYCRIKNFKNYIDYILNLAKLHSSEKFTHYAFQSEHYIYKALNESFTYFTFLHVYIITLIELITFIFNWIKNKKPSWIHAGLFAFPFIIVLSSFVGTCGEFMRTALCCIPFTYISLVILLNKIFTNKNAI